MNCRNASARPARRTSWWRNAAAAAALALFGTAQAQVTVTGATAGGNGPYATLGAAFAAINAATHTGESIVITIDANTTESGPAVLNSNAWTSLTIYPSVGGVTISGATATGRGLIELNGADNVTINGAVGGTGTTRDLTITNTAANTVTYTAVVRLAVLASTQTSADGNTIRNCVLNGSATGRNASGNTSTTGSENTTFGIYAGGKGAATTPAAITSVTSDTAPSGTTVNNLTVANNTVNACARAVVFNGAAATVSAGTLSITDNIIGGSGTLGAYPFTSPTNTVYTKGILINGATAVVITGNTLRNILSYVGTGMSAIELNGSIGAGALTINNNSVIGVANNGTSSGANGIVMGASAAGTFTINGNIVSNIQHNSSSSNSGIAVSGGTATAGMIQNNQVSTVYSRSTSGWAARGITLSSGNSITVQNNMVWDINAYTGNATTSDTYVVRGIFVSAGTGHKLYHNSVLLSGALLGGTSADVTACIGINATARTGLDVRNNLLSNTMTGNASVVHTCLQLPTGGTSAMSLTLNNNAYYTGSAASSYALTTSSTFAGYTAANFNAGATTPATNMRAYTSTLSAAGTNDNASFASTAAAPFASASDLHVNLASAQAVAVNGTGATGTGVTTDIDGDARSTPPDIGADEFVLAVCNAANGGAITPGTASACANGTYSMTATSPEAGLGITYQWEVSTTGGGVGFADVTGGSGATTPNYTTGTLSVGTYYYRLRVTCSTGPVTGYSNELALTVNAQPVASASSNSPVCAGQTLNLLGSSDIGTSYSWTGPASFSSTDQNPVINNAGNNRNGTYTVVATANGCPSAPATTSVSILAAPTVSSVTATPAVICAGGNSQLQATASFPPYAIGSGGSSFIDISTTGTPIGSMTDDAEFNITFPSFTFNGVAYTGARVGDNGIIALGASSGDIGIGGSALPVSNFGSAAVGSIGLAPWWTDLDPYTAGSIRTEQVGNLFIIQWSTYGHDDLASTNTIQFQAQLDIATGVIYFAYSDVFYTPTGSESQGGTATIGLSFSSSSALQYSFNTKSLSDGQVISFTPASITSYLWSPADFLTDPSIANPEAVGVTATTAYTVTVTASNGCSSTGNVTVNAGDPLVASITASLDTICAGGTTNLSSTVTGGGTPYTYAWSDETGPLGTNATLSGYAPTQTRTVTLTVTDNCGAQVAPTKEIVVKPTPTATAGGPGSVCNGAPLNLTGTTDIGTSFTWSGPSSYSSTEQNPQVTATAAAANVGTYTFRATLNGCISAPSTTTVSLNPNPVIASTTATPATICAGSNSQLQVSASAPGYTMGSGGASFIDISASGTSVGTMGDDSEFNITFPAFTFNGVSYTAARVGDNGGIAFGATTGDINTGSSLPATSLGSGSGAVGLLPWWDDLDPLTTGTIKTEQVGGVFIIQWSTYNHNTEYPGNTIQFQVQLEPATGKIYFVYQDVSFTASASESQGGSATIGLSFSATSALQYSFNTKSLTDGQVISFTPNAITSYAWTPTTYLNDATIANPLASGVMATTPYSVQVTGSNGCSATGNVTVTIGTGNAPSVTSSAGGPTTFCAGGSVVLSSSVTEGCAPFTYAWSNGVTTVGTDPTYTATASGSYTLTVTDNASQTGTSTPIVVTVNPTPTSVPTSNTPVCAGGTLNLAGGTDIGTTFSWTGPNSFTSTQQNPSITNTTTANSGVYSLVVSDGTCTSAAATTTVVIGTPTGTVTVTPATASICPGSSVSLTASGGLVSGTMTSGAGASTTVPNTTTSTLGPNPMQSYYGNTKLQMMWTAAELAALGYSAGSSITSVAVNMAAIESGRDYLNFRVKVQQTAAVTSLSTIVGTGWNTVYGPVTVTPVVGYNTFMFSSPVIWDGTSNLLIEMNHRNNDGGSTGTATATAKYDLGLSYTACNFYRVDNAGTDMDAFTGTPSFTYSGRPQVRLGSIIGGGTFTWAPGATLNTTTGPTVTASPTEETTYTATYTLNGCSSSGTATVSIGTPTPPSVEISAGGPTSLCTGGSVLLSSNVTGGCAPFTYAWSDGVTTVGTDPTYTATASGTYTLSIMDFAGQPASSNSITVTVNPIPTASASSNSPICAGSALDLMGTTDVGTSFSWTGPDSFTSSDEDPVIASATAAATGTYTFTATAAGCTSAPATVAVVVNAGPTGVTANASSTSVCAGSTVDLTGTATTTGTLLNENFNGAAPGWTTTNASVGGTVANAAWTLRPNGYTVVATGDDPTFNSNDASQFYLTNSDNQGSSALTLTTLVSPSFSLTGYIAATLGFYHHYKDIADNGDSAVVEVSTNNGATWAIAQAYTTTLGTPNGFVSASVPLDAFVGQSDVRVRFRFIATWDWWWAVDNVTVTGTAAPASFAWTSSPEGFTSNAQNPTGVVVGQTTTYTVAATGLNGCSTTASVTVNANQPVNAGTNGATTVCSVDAPFQLSSFLGGSPDAGGAWTGPTNAAHSGTFDPATDAGGVYTYTVTGTAPCPNATATVTVTRNVATAWYADVDGDGFGDPATSQMACARPSGYVADNTDQCVNDPNKRVPGQCGCGVPDTDGDGDGIADCVDNCPTVPGVIGSTCNDNDDTTINDVLNASCTCEGTPVAPCPGGSNVAVVLNTDAHGEQTSWEIIPFPGGGPAVCSGSNYANNTTITESCCLPNGCYALRVLDSFGDGMTTGGYTLRDANNQRIIDNAGNGSGFTTVSQMTNNGFCLPLGPDHMMAESCDQLQLTNASVLRCEPNPAVQAQWLVGNMNDDGYEFHIFDPNGGYSRKITITNATTTTGGPYGNTRSTYLKISAMVTLPVPQFKLLNVRVRSIVNGVAAEYGPVCRMKIDPSNACQTTQLTTVGLPVISCGATNIQVPGGRLYANEIPGATTYLFQFVAPGYLRNITSNTRMLTIGNWYTLPLSCGTTYDVRVRASLDNGATFCPFGATCQITTSPCARPDNRISTDSEALANDQLRMWPNPNNGQQLFLMMDEFNEPVEKVTVDMTDIFGKRVLSETIAVGGGGLNTVMQLNDRLSGGVYMVTLTAGEQTITKRLVIQR